MPNELLILEKQLLEPQLQTFMLAGFWQQANGGNVSSGIPQYLIDKLNARKIGRILKDHFYESSARISYKDGFEVDYQEVSNDFYFSEVSGKGLVIFSGSSPNFKLDEYATAFLDGVQELNVKRVVSISSRYDEVPFDKERVIGGTYSLQHMKRELENYALTFSQPYTRWEDHNVAINHIAKGRNIELVRMSVRVPAIPLPNSQAYALETDHRAFYDVLRRVRHMFGIELDLSDIQRRSEEEHAQATSQIGQLIRQYPDLKQHLDVIEQNFQGLTFVEPTKLSPGLEEELGSILRKPENR